MHDDKQREQLFLINYNTVHAVEKNIMENRWTYHISLHEIVWVAEPPKIMYTLGSKDVHRKHKMKQQDSALSFLLWFKEQGDDSLNSSVIGDDTDWDNNQRSGDTFHCY